MPTCLQCGSCCLGIEWTFTYKAENEDPENPSQEILSRAIARMKYIGIRYYQFRRAELNANHLSMTFKVGVCQNLRFEDGKAHCLTHDDRAQICKGYFCDKAKQADPVSTR